MALNPEDATRLAKAYRRHHGPHNFTIASDERIVTCITCKSIFTVHESDYATAVDYHKHAPGTSSRTKPTYRSKSAATRIFMQEAHNHRARIYQYTCGYCVRLFSYRPDDAELAVAHHLGGYCQNPSMDIDAPQPLSSEALHGRSAALWKKEQDEIRNVLLALINDHRDPSRAQSPAPKRPHEDTHDDSPPSTPTAKRTSVQRGRHLFSAQQPSEEDDEQYMDAADDEEVSALSDPPPSPARPPPIFIDDTWDDDYFIKKTRYATGLTHPFQCKLTRSGDGLLLRCRTLQDYHILVAKLREHKEPFTTRTPRDERVARFVAARLPIGIPDSHVLSELQAKSLPITAAHRLTDRDRANNGTTRRLTAVVCSFPPGTPLEKVAAAAPTIADCEVKWHVFDGKGEPIQCYKCQDFNHSSRNCNRENQCRKCSRYHASRDCDTPDNNRCANCGNAHRSTYKGCPYYKEIKTSNVTARSRTAGPINHRTQVSRQPCPPSAPPPPPPTAAAAAATAARRGTLSPPPPPTPAPVTASSSESDGTPADEPAATPLPPARWRNTRFTPRRQQPAPRRATQPPPWWTTPQAQTQLKTIEMQNSSFPRPPPPPLTSESFPALPTRTAQPPPPTTATTGNPYLRPVLKQLAALGNLIVVRDLPPHIKLQHVCTFIEEALTPSSTRNFFDAVNKLIEAIAL